VVGISGATCSGKTTVCKILRNIFVNSRLFHQDEYYWLEDSKNHVRDSKTGFINWEVMSSFDMQSALKDLKSELAASSGNSKKLQPRQWTIDNTFKNPDSYETIIDPTTFEHIRLIVVEGILVLNDPEISERCDHRFFFELDKATCWHRRKSRTYDPEDQIGYFEGLAWPFYLSNLAELQTVDRPCTFLRGEASIQENVCRILNSLQEAHEK